MSENLIAFFDQISFACKWMHLPVVFLLILFSRQVRYNLQHRPFTYIYYAWVLNFLHILLKLFFEFDFFERQISVEEIQKSANKTQEFFKFAIGTFFDFLNSFMFLLAAKYAKYERTNKSLDILIALNLKYIILGFISLFVIQIYLYSLHVTIFYIDIHKLPSVIIAVVSLMALSVYFFFLYEKSISWTFSMKEVFSIFKEGRYLQIATLLFCILQLLALINTKELMVIEPIGYLLSIGIKITFLYGLHRLFLIEANKSITTEKLNKTLNDILGLTFHELTTPLNEIREKLEYAETVSDTDWKMSKPVFKVYNSLESNFTRIRAIISASLKQYKFSITNKSDLLKNIFNNDSLKTPSTRSHNSVNNLIEVTVQSIKRNLGEKVIFIIDYSRDCIVFCDELKFIQVIDNVLRNSIESFENKKGRIKIKTRKIKEGDIKMVQITIADDGIGINDDVINNVFEKGFSTKKNNPTDIRGYGLSVVSELAKDLQGKVEIESPYDFKNFLLGSKTGTKITLTFKNSHKE